MLGKVKWDVVAHFRKEMGVFPGMGGAGSTQEVATLSLLTRPGEMQLRASSDKTLGEHLVCHKMFW